jgi:hypothetical protein
MEIIAANIEMLAEAEHNDWMEFKIRNGWAYGEPRDDLKKIHDCLRPYRELSERTRRRTETRSAFSRYPQEAIIKSYRAWNSG